MLGYVVDNRRNRKNGSFHLWWDNKETDVDRIPFRFYPCFSDLVRLVEGKKHSVEYDISDVEADVFEALEGSLYP